MEIIEQRDGQTAILAISGALDTMSAPALSERAIALCENRVRAILINFEQVSHLTSAGFRALMAIQRRTEPASIGLALCGLNELVLDLFEVSGLRSSFRIYPDQASALAAIAERHAT
jgi:anti-anti-sigma factor